MNYFATNPKIDHNAPFKIWGIRMRKQFEAADEFSLTDDEEDEM